MRLTRSTVHKTTETNTETPQINIGIGPHIQFGNSKVRFVNGIVNRTTQYPRVVRARAVFKKNTRHSADSEVESTHVLNRFHIVPFLIGDHRVTLSK
jgi:hypothetical protein